MNPTLNPSDDAPNPAKGTITIYYCTQCRWMLRSAWMLQELLSTFDSILDEASLRPAQNGRFEIWCSEQLIWERQRDGGFPEIKELKRRVRDRLQPERDLGHCDR